MTPRPFSQANDEEVEEVEPSRHYIYLADPINNTRRKYYIEVDNTKRINTRTISTIEKNMFDSAINYYHVSKQIDEELRFSQQDIADYAQQKSIPKTAYQYKSGSASDGQCNDAYHYATSTDCEVVINGIILDKYNDRGLWEKITDVVGAVDLTFNIANVSSATIKGNGFNKQAVFDFENGSRLVINLDISGAAPRISLDKLASYTARGQSFQTFEQVVKDLNSNNLTAVDADIIVDYYSERGYSCVVNTSTKASYRYKISKVDNDGVKYIYVDVHTDVSDEHDIECRGN
ncbi:hypothetical protein [Thalassotalea sp. PLHSN55]|uniref:hypothetical protein n=1 Tax=Thalassotalea sp. PLHSN55 TaxID=3435888 RepID=UPI003F82C990